VTGVKVPGGVLGVTTVVGAHVAHGTLPFTGVALGTYAAVSGGLILSGIGLRVLARVRDTR
jgi:hypothetical protein